MFKQQFNWQLHFKITLQKYFPFYVGILSGTEFGHKIIHISVVSEITHCGLVTPWCLGSWTTSFQVIACCLSASSHYLKQCWLIISKVFGIHLMAVSKEMLKTYILNMSVKITNLRLQLHQPGASELICCTMCMLINTKQYHQAKFFFPRLWILNMVIEEKCETHCPAWHTVRCCCYCLKLDHQWSI